MQLTVLGSNGTYPTAGRPASGYLVRTPSTTLWMDAGSGTCGAVQAFVDPTEIDAIVISHAHADHCADLLAFYHVAAFGPTRVTGIPVYAADLVEERLRGFLSADVGHPFDETYSFRSVSGGDSVEVGDLSLSFADAQHSVPCVATRADWRNASLVYTGDTGPCERIVELAAGADVLLAEAAYQGDDKPYPHHMTAHEAGDMATAAGVTRLVLTHITPALDPNRSIGEASSRFSGTVRVAVPGTTVSI